MIENRTEGMQHRTRLMRLGVLSAAVVIMTLGGCDSDDSADGSADDSGQTIGATASISTNHGHTAAITTGQLQAGAAVTIELTPGNAHTHTVSFTSAQVQTIDDGGSASAPSTFSDGHSHSVTFN